MGGDPIGTRSARIAGPRFRFSIPMDLDVGSAQLILRRGREVDDQLIGRVSSFAQVDLVDVSFGVWLL